MPSFSQRSKDHLAGVNPRLRQIYEEAIKHFDCQIIDGARTIEEQKKNVARGVSKTMDSMHLPAGDGLSRAVDAMPYPYDWTRIQRGLDAVKRADATMEVCRVYMFIGFIKGIAAAKGVPVRLGADWDGDEQVGDHTFIDLPHCELL